MHYRHPDAHVEIPAGLPHPAPAPNSTRLPIVVRTAVVSSCLTFATGCGYNARDEFLATQAVTVAASEGDGSTIAALDADWPSFSTIGTGTQSVRADVGVEPLP